MLRRRRIFVSYSHRDRRYLERLRVHLQPLEREGIIDLWDDTRLAPGSDWQHEIAAAVASAKVAILLISADFLASSFIVEKELPPLLVAAKQNGAAVLPVIIGACRFTTTKDLASFQAANDPSRPLATLPFAERERIWVRVADAVEAALADREPAEGWNVANERRVLQALNELVNCEAGSYLVITGGDHYVQFMREDYGLHCEAVSNAFLPNKLHLSREKIRQLLSLGFKKPDKDFRNYYKTFEVKDSSSPLASIAALVVKVMSEIYEVSRQPKLDIGSVTRPDPN
jgi:hypothetical protein